MQWESTRLKKWCCCCRLLPVVDGRLVLWAPTYQPPSSAINCPGRRDAFTASLSLQLSLKPISSEIQIVAHFCIFFFFSFFFFWLIWRLCRRRWRRSSPSGESEPFRRRDATNFNCFHLQLWQLLRVNRFTISLHFIYSIRQRFLSFFASFMSQHLHSTTLPTKLTDKSTSNEKCSSLIISINF